MRSNGHRAGLATSQALVTIRRSLVLSKQAAMRRTGLLALAVLAVGLATLLLAQFAMALQPVVLPTLRELGHDPTFVLGIGGFWFSGWKLLVFEGTVLIIGLGLIAFALYMFLAE